MLTDIDLANLGASGVLLLRHGTFMGFGWSLSAGDFNGDGIDDFIVSLPLDNGSVDPGGAYLIYGKAEGIGLIDLDIFPASSGMFIKGAPGNVIAIEFVHGGGDFNGDGVEDLLICTPRANSSAGKTTVIFGGSSNATIDLANLSSEQGIVINGVSSELTGDVAEFAGDVNGDGFDDIIIGQPSNTGGGVFVIFGKNDGLSTINLANIDASQGFFVGAEKTGDGAGVSVSSLGDINGDGLDDIIVGAPVADAIQDLDPYFDRGKAYVIYGSTQPFGTIHLSNLTPSQGFTIEGGGYRNYAGTEVAAAGDVNGDGLNDLLVTSDQKVFVIFGVQGGLSNVNLGTLDQSAGFVIIPQDYNLGFGEAVVGTGDVNGDGFDDIIVGERLGNTGGEHAGEAFVIFGKASGFQNVDLAQPGSGDGYHLVGAAAGSSTGQSVSLADVNGDGFDDMLVGAPHSSAGGTESGAAYVVYAASPNGSVTRIGTIADQTLAGGAFADQLEGRGGEDRLYGNGGVDTLLGEDGNDWLNGGAGADSMAGGADNDRYVVDNVGDVTTENADQGTDTVETGLGTGSTLAQRQAAQYQLATNIEDLVGTGVGQGLRGNDLDNHISAGSGDDFVNASDGGADDVQSGDGRDVIYYGAALTGADKNDAGDEGGDTRGDLLVIQGDYNITLGADALIDVEKFRTLKGENTSFGDTGGNSYSYDITTVDANVAAGARVVVQGGSLQLGEHLKFNGAAETDGSFQIFGGHDSDELIGGAQGDHLLGRSGNDILTGNGGDDRLRGGLGADTMDGGSGADTFVYAPLAGAEPYSNAALESTGTGYDTITGFDFTSDKIDLPQTVSAFASLGTGALNNASFNADLAAAVDGTLAVNGVVLFTADSGDLTGDSFLIVDADGDGAYQTDHDFVIQLVGATGTVPATPDFFV